MAGFSPRSRLIACLVLAGVGLALFFSGEYRDIPFPLGWIGTLLFVAATWFCVDQLHRIPRSDGEAAIAPGEWQAWVGLAFASALIGVSLRHAAAFSPPIPIGRNPDAAAVGRQIGTLFVAWLVLANMLKWRWAGKVLADERDARIELLASQWARGATAAVVIGIAVMLGFSDTERLQQFSYPFIAQMLVFALLWGLWFDQLVAAILYWRDRRAVS